jgi:TctA family transporter
MDLVATALPALSEAFALILQPQQLMYLAIGVLLGLSVGVFPGLGGIAGLSLVLPFMFGMEPVSGLALMVGLIAVVPTSDTFASVLLGIPGSILSPVQERRGSARAVGRVRFIAVWRIARGGGADRVYPDCAAHYSGLWPA